MSDKPFYDWDAINEDPAKDLYKSAKEYSAAIDALTNCDPDDTEAIVKAAQEAMRAHEFHGELLRDLRDWCYTQPATVHIAGPKKEETNPDNPMQEGILQRCSRCGSILSFWTEGMRVLGPDGIREVDEDQLPWWDEGKVVAKVNRVDGAIQQYEIGDRELEKYEHECADLSGLESALLDES